MLDFSVTFFITIINIAVLFLVLRKILFKPVTKFMNDRSKRIEDSIRQAESDKARAKVLLEQYEIQLESARAEADAIIRAAREKAVVEAERIAAEGRLEAEKNLRDAQIQIETERQAALALFRIEAAALVTAASGRLLAREFKNEDNARYARMLLNETAENR